MNYRHLITSAALITTATLSCACTSNIHNEFADEILAPGEAVSWTMDAPGFRFRVNNKGPAPALVNVNGSSVMLVLAGQSGSLPFYQSRSPEPVTITLRNAATDSVTSVRWLFYAPGEWTLPEQRREFSH